MRICAGILAVFFVLLFAFNPSVYGQKKGGTFIPAIPFDPITLNPGLTTSLHSHTACEPAFNSLLETNLDMSLRSGLAERWERSTDGKTYTFYLVKNATWHDGKKFTSSDVKFTFEKVLIPLHPQGRINFGSTESIETPDDYTVKFTLSKASPSFPIFVGSPYLAPILPKHIFDGTDISQNPANFKPVGTGAFRFVEYVKGDKIVYERNPDYWRAGKPYMDKLIIKIIPTEETQILAIQKNEIDFIPYEISPQGINRLKDTPSVNIVRVQDASPSLTWLYFNLDNPILKNLKVRQAIAHAIDRGKISEITRLGVSPPAVGPIHMSFRWAYDPNLQPSYPTDKTKANSLLDEAGYPRGEGGIRFKLSLNSITGTLQAVDGQVIKDQLKDVGIDVDLQLLTLASANELLFSRRQFDMATRLFSTGPDPSKALAVTFHSNQVGAGTYTNAMGYRNSKADDLLSQAEVEMDLAKRKQILLEWQQIIMTDLPGYPILQESFGQVVRKVWVGIPANPWRVSTMFTENIWWTEGTSIEPTKTTTTQTTLPPSPAGSDLTLVGAVAVVAVLVAAGTYYTLYRKRRSSGSK